MLRFVLKRPLLFYILVGMYFDARLISIHTPITRVRWIQLSVIFIPFAILVMASKARKLTFKKIDLFLLLFILLNFVSLFWSVDEFLTLKVSGLLLINFLIYYYVRLQVEEIYAKGELSQFLEVFALIALVNIAFGIYQAFAGYLDKTLHMNLWVGIYGITQAGYAGLPFGRPYAFLQEPDYYGELCMFFFFFSILLLSSEIAKPRLKRNLKWLFYFSSLGLMLSLVRGALLAVLIGMVVLISIRKRVASRDVLGNRVRRFAVQFLLMALVAILLIPQGAFQKRFAVDSSTEGISLQNSRLVMVLYSLHLFSQSPWVGYGTNSFATLGVWGASDTYYNRLLNQGDIGIEARYDPNIITTVLTDLGLVGLFVFGLLIIRFFRENLKAYFHGYMIHIPFFFPLSLLLLITYQFTTAFWAPYFWIFLGIDIGLVESTKTEMRRT